MYRCAIYELNNANITTLHCIDVSYVWFALWLAPISDGLIDSDHVILCAAVFLAFVCVCERAWFHSSIHPSFHQSINHYFATQNTPPMPIHYDSHICLDQNTNWRLCVCPSLARLTTNLSVLIFYMTWPHNLRNFLLLCSFFYVSEVIIF